MDVPPAPADRRPSALRARLHRAAGWAALAVALLAVALGGCALRRWAWGRTEPDRYVLDIDNAFRQGTRTLATGFVERYDDEAAEPTHEWVSGLDYGPGRLAVATLWARWVRERVTAPALGADPLTDEWTVEFYPWARRAGDPYALCRPLLLFNLAGEGLAAVALFLLVRRYASDGGTRPVRGTVLASAAASLFWLDPALITNAHCWPQWDSWVLPFLLWATLLASVDLWFCAGVAVAAGAMFKGQILFGVPFLLMWPLCQGRPGAAARWVSGFAAAVASITAVWLVRTPGGMQGFLYVRGHTDRAAVRWVVEAAAAGVLVAWAARGSGQRIDAAAQKPRTYLRASAWRAARLGGKVLHRPSSIVRVCAAVAAVLLIALPLHRAGAFGPTVAAVAALAAVVWIVPARSLGHVAAAWAAAALLTAWPAFGASGQWFYTGIAHGTTARTAMSNGDNNNLADLLNTVWGWRLEDPVPHTLPPGRAGDAVVAFLRSIDRHVDLPARGATGLPLKYVLVILWLAVTTACAAAAAAHDRRRNPRFLLAAATPWVVMFAVLGQMHQRYLLWGATLTAGAAAVSPGLVLLHLLLSVVAAGQELSSMMANAHHTDNALYRLAHGWTPGMGWAVLLTAGVFVYGSVTPGRRRLAVVGRGPNPGAAAEQPKEPGQQDRAGQVEDACDHGRQELLPDERGPRSPED